MSWKYLREADKEGSLGLKQSLVYLMQIGDEQYGGFAATVARLMLAGQLARHHKELTAFLQKVLAAPPAEQGPHAPNVVPAPDYRKTQWRLTWRLLAWILEADGAPIPSAWEPAMRGSEFLHNVFARTHRDYALDATLSLVQIDAGDFAYVDKWFAPKGAFRKRKTADLATRETVRYLATAVRANAKPSDLEPWWTSFRETFGNEPARIHKLEYFFLVGRLIHHRIRGVPVAQVGASLRREMDR